MVESAFAGGGHVPGDPGDFPLHGHVGNGAEFHFSGREDTHFAVVEINDVFRIGGQSRHVAGEHVRAVAHSDHDRTAVPRGHDQPGMLRGDHRDPVGSDQLLEGGGDRLDKVPVIIFGDQVRDHLAVRVRQKRVSGCLQTLPQRRMVFDDAVVNDGDFPFGIQMRMRVLFQRRSVRGPPCMGDSRRAFEVQSVQVSFICQIYDFSNGLYGHETIPVQAQSRRVISAVFQTFQTVDQDSARFGCSGVSYDSTHDCLASQVKSFQKI
ncbi:MAG: hypothetical protein BWY31_04736 [Lentisphaerae bacterium ADurb.Bin242]|nr:MAG: hypothetical protein BWY31_04736 [Lentisphaerae bacterium ADurb.Bin242]